MFDTLPPDSDIFKTWSWEQIKPYYDDLAGREVTADTLGGWLADWSHLADLVKETETVLYVATTLDTTDEAAQKAFQNFFENIFPSAEAAEQVLREKLLASGLEPEGFAVPLRKMRADAELFREENLSLLTEEQKLNSEYDRILGAQTVKWEGEEITVRKLMVVMQEPDRSRREKAYRTAVTRQMQDREALNALWVQYMALRTQIATNAGYDNYRAYRWEYLKRFDFTPEDCLAFHDAIEEVIVPAASRMYERRRRKLGVETLRPWDQYCDPLGRPALKPYQAIEQLDDTCDAIFHRVDPKLGGYYDIMRTHDLLDLDNRKGKAPGAYSTPYDAKGLPFIFCNSVGTHDDVATLLHEAGHAFHAFESAHLPYHHQRTEAAIPAEVAEVASMSMELLAAPYLRRSEGGFYDDADYARARIEHLEGNLGFWPYMAVVDAFQHWVYTHQQAASDPANCDAQWSELWDRFMPGIDFSGLEDVRATRWQRQPHISAVPFYYVEYGFAQLGAAQIWANALDDQEQAVADYRKALALGGTVTTPEFYAAAGARFAFDAGTLQKVVDLIEKTIDEMETLAGA